MITPFAIAQKDTNWVKNNLIISATPTHFFEFFHGPSANVGIEVRANKRYSFYGEFGKYIPNTLFSSNYDQKGHSFLVEAKRYFENGRTYFSLQYMQGKQNYIRTDFIAYDQYSSEYYEYSIDKTFQDISIRYGGVYVFKNRYTFNPYIGIGLRHHNADVELTYQQEIDREYGGSDLPHNWVHKGGSQIYPKLHFGMRFGIRVF
ncbi:MAG: hypothetical protein ACI8ZM_000131 [Crocinitomix sp.]|jgi:hypothetical protein